MNDNIQRKSLEDLTRPQLKKILDAYEDTYTSSASKPTLVKLVQASRDRNPDKILANDPTTDEWRVVDKPTPIKTAAAVVTPVEGEAAASPGPFTPPPVSANEVLPKPDADERKFHSIKVRYTGLCMNREMYDVELDGKPMMTRSIDFSAAFDDVSIVTLELMVDDIDLELSVEDKNLRKADNPYDNYMLTAYRTLIAQAMGCDKPRDREKAVSHIVLREMKSYLQHKKLLPIDILTDREKLERMLERTTQ